MSSTKTKASSTSKTKKALSGIIIGLFEDNGPISRYHNTRLSKEIINKMVVHGMSAVHGTEDMLGGLFGPLPVFEKTDLRYLIYSFKVKASNTKDERIVKHGRVCSLFLLLKKEQQRFILNHHMTIEKTLIDYQTKNWKKELDVSKDSMIVLYNLLNDQVTVKGLRAFSYGEAGLTEYADPHLLLDDGILAIIDNKKETIYMYLPLEKFKSRMRINAVEKLEELNLREYGSLLKIEKLRDYMKFKKILEKHSIQIVK